MITFPFNRFQANVTSLVLLIALGTPLGVGLLGCKDPNKVVTETKETYVVIEQVAREVAEMSSSLCSTNLAKAKELGGKLDQVLSTRMVSWSMQILSTEEKEGIAAAKALIEKYKATEGITENEKAALTQIEKYFESKGTQRTGDIAVNIAAFAVEKKYGKTASKLFVKLSSNYRSAPAVVPAVSTNAIQPQSTNAENP